MSPWRSATATTKNPDTKRINLNKHIKHIIKRWAAVARMRIEEWQA
jgi:hypothetical protein